MTAFGRISVEPLVFFGSGPVAARSLELLAETFAIEAVITKPQPAHHKEPFPVLALCERLNLPVFTPYGKTELSELFSTKPLHSRLGVVIDYGFIINQDVIDYFPLGIINSHFSLLPEWRGADPITFSILSGQDETGVSLMRITAGMDEGPILSQGVHPISGRETTPELTEQLISLSDALLKDALPRYAQGEISPISQEAAATVLGRDTEPSYSRKLSKEDGLLDFTKPAAQLEREVRAFIEWPKSRTTLAGKDVVVTKCHVLEEEYAPGEVTAKDKQLVVGCGVGSLSLDEIKPAGKNKMTAAAFLAGYGHTL